ncbi:restriction modification system DNA specificity domain (plasmid) [Prosthecochloris aestuarii DSM 271]|uniref:Restriction modification system DNA specificity domain n=1 Tax=Prosthecochloris aestuarii (strain DSM 271 / SK 413) TaxID=290512 RepID=B4S9Q8_PROA2|nr:restriction modification system DNA specificity domain [Prosthecochloris aestuarii DSM 271]
MSNTIKKDKQALVPRLRFSEFRAAGEWGVACLGDLGEFAGGGTPSKTISEYWDGNIPWISSSDVSDESITDVSISRFITNEAIKCSATKLIPSGSILLVSRVGVGKLAIIDSPVCTSQDFTNFTPSKDNALFLGYYLKSNGHALENLCQGMAIKGFTKNDVSKIVLALPDLTEQQKIADCLFSLNALIAAHAEKIEALKTHKKGLMQQLFPREGETVPRLRFPEFRDAGEWESAFGDNVFDQVSNKEHNSDLPVLAITQEHGAIPRDMIDYHVSVTDKSIEGYKVVDVGDFIISLRSFQGGIEYSRFKGICSPAYVILRLRKGYSAGYFRQYLKTDRFISQLTKNLEGLRDGKMISYKQFSELSLPIPSQNEQQKIADCLSSLDALIAAHAEKLDALKTHKKGLMQQLFPRPEAVGA